MLIERRIRMLVMVLVIFVVIPLLFAVSGHTHAYRSWGGVIDIPVGLLMLEWAIHGATRRS